MPSTEGPKLEVSPRPANSPTPAAPTQNQVDPTSANFTAEQIQRENWSRSHLPVDPSAPDPVAPIQASPPVSAAPCIIPLVAADNQVVFERQLRGRYTDQKELNTGFTVADLQKLLVKAGFDVEVDNKFGPKTMAAVVAYQQGLGMVIGSEEGMANGKVSIGLMRELLGEGRLQRTENFANIVETHNRSVAENREELLASTEHRHTGSSRHKRVVESSPMALATERAKAFLAAVSSGDSAAIANYIALPKDEKAAMLAFLAKAAGLPPTRVIEVEGKKRNVYTTDKGIALLNGYLSANAETPIAMKKALSALINSAYAENLA